MRDKILIVRIKKSFRKYKQFWYNGQAGVIFFVKSFSKDEFKIVDFDNNFPYGIVIPKNHNTVYFILKKHAEVIGKL
jgi:hypothetical protein